MSQSIDSRRILIGAVLQNPEEPPAVRPLRFEFHRLPVKLDCLRNVSLGARGRGFRADGIEVSRRRLGEDRLGERGHNYSHDQDLRRKPQPLYTGDKPQLYSFIHPNPVPKSVIFFEAALLLAWPGEDRLPAFSTIAETYRARAC